MRALVSNLKVFLYFCQTSFNVVYFMLSLIIGGKLSRCILANCAFINRRLAPTVSTICTTAQQHNWQTTKLASSGIAISNMDGNIIFNSGQHSDSNTLWNEDKVWFLHVFGSDTHFQRYGGGEGDDTQQYRGATTCLKTQILKNVRRRSFQTEDLTISTSEG